jgi:hypothetical protein
LFSSGTNSLIQKRTVPIIFGIINDLTTDWLYNSIILLWLEYAD